jgi:nucleoside-diphosphate-sugar epimerase
MAHSRRVLITGATGAVGPLVVNAFRLAGFSVRTLSIDPPPVGNWHNDVETLTGDVNDVPVLQAVMKDVEVVAHLAALLHIVNPLPALEEKYERINVEGTATVVDTAIRTGVRRVVFFSTIAVYGPSGGGTLTEETVPCPDTFYGRTKLLAEKIVLEAKETEGRKIGSVLRLGAVYGSRIKGNYQRLAQSLARGRFVPVGNGLNRRTLVYDKDVACAAVLAATHDHAAGRVYNVTDGGFHTLNDVIAAICGALGRRPPRFSLPTAPIRLVAGLAESAAGLLHRRSPVTTSMIDKYNEDIAVSGERIQRELGFVPQYNLTEGWQQAVREMREAGAL